MNLFLFLNKYGSKTFYFDFIIKINKKEYKLKVYKNGTILNNDNSDIKEPLIINFEKLLFKYNEVNLSTPLPIKVDKKIKNQMLIIYVPKNKNNIMTFNRLVKRNRLLKDCRFKKKSIFDIYNSCI
jgi:hypothetical protein